MELVLALGLSVVLLLASGSAILIASRALPDAGRYAALASGQRVLDEIAWELEGAESITKIGPGEVEFTPAGAPATMRYWWVSPQDGKVWRKLPENVSIEIATQIGGFGGEIVEGTGDDAGRAVRVDLWVLDDDGRELRTSVRCRNKPGVP